MQVNVSVNIWTTILYNIPLPPSHTPILSESINLSFYIDPTSLPHKIYVFSVSQYLSLSLSFLSSSLLHPIYLCALNTFMASFATQKQHLEWGEDGVEKAFLMEWEIP